jgi:precorrin-6A/cobalt-precorrin-6A reductase
MLLIAHAITHIVCRNSGGTAAYAKIEAARDLGLPVIMVSQNG